MRKAQSELPTCRCGTCDAQIELPRARMGATLKHLNFRSHRALRRPGLPAMLDGFKGEL